MVKSEKNNSATKINPKTSKKKSTKVNEKASKKKSTKPNAKASKKKFSKTRALRPLTTRELEVLKHLVLGKSNTKIGEELNISSHTVKAHVCIILRKMAVTDRVQIAVKAVRDGLVK